MNNVNNDNKDNKQNQMRSQITEYMMSYTRKDVFLIQSNRRKNNTNRVIYIQKFLLEAVLEAQ